MDETSSVLIRREDEPLDEDLSESSEVMKFSGEKNSILLSHEYYTDFSCEFKLHFYPFDTQKCQMIFTAIGKTDNFLRLVKDGNGVKMEGIYLLLKKSFFCVSTRENL